MTYKQFLSELRKTPRDWRLINASPKYGSDIRRGKSQCPITALADAPSGEVQEVGRSLGIKYPLRYRIINAADGFTNGRVRRDLLAACGLKEGKP